MWCLVTIDEVGLSIRYNRVEEQFRDTISSIGNLYRDFVTTKSPLDSISKPDDMAYERMTEAELK